MPHLESTGSDYHYGLLRQKTVIGGLQDLLCNTSPIFPPNYRVANHRAAIRMVSYPFPTNKLKLWHHGSDRRSCIGQMYSTC